MISAGIVFDRIVLAFSGAVPVFAEPVLECMRAEKDFDQTLRRCDQIVQCHAGWSVLKALEQSQRSGPLLDFAFNTPLFVSVQLSLLELLRSLGLRGYAALGISGGEISAACAAGMIDLPEALRIACCLPPVLERRARDLRMANIAGSDLQLSEMASLLEPGVAIAATTGATTFSVSGEIEPLQRTLRALQQLGIRSRPMPFPWGVHHPSLRDDRACFETRLGALTVAQPYGSVLFCSATEERPSNAGANHWWPMVSERVCLDTSDAYSGTE